MKGSKQKEAVPASDSGAPELDPAQANKSGPQLDSDSAQASVEGPLATLNIAESLNLSNGHLSESSSVRPRLLGTAEIVHHLDKVSWISCW